MNYKVSVNYCEDYDINEVSKCIDKSLVQLGGLSNYIKPKMRVMLKCNLQTKHEPNDAFTTHPTLVSVIAEKICKLGASCVIVDSPESCANNAIEKIYEVSEMLNVSNEGYAELNNNFSVFRTDIDGVITKQLTLLDVLNECDVIVNIPKLLVDKNGIHTATESLFSLMPSEMKVIAQNRLWNADDYNNYLLDIYSHIKDKVVLNIVDGVVARENGSQRIINAIIMGDNIFAVDSLCYKLANVDFYSSSLYKVAEKRNLFTSTDQVVVLGTNVEMFKKEDFSKPETDYKKVSKRKQCAGYKAYQKRPLVKRKECKGCKRCMEVCPVKAISEKYDKNNEICATIDYGKCINCLRCIKTCPYSAIDTKVPIKFNKLNSKIDKRVK